MSTPDAAPATEAAPKTAMQRILDTVERVGNKVPHPVMIFVYLIVTKPLGPSEMGGFFRFGGTNM